MVSDINNLINFFFITLIINFFVTFYSIYIFFDFVIFQNKQGTKLNIKKDDLYAIRKEDKK